MSATTPSTWPASGSIIGLTHAPVSSTAQPVFYEVSMAKMTLMSLSTFGIYEIYWMYRNWRVIKQRDHSDISPFWRAAFGSLFCYLLFKELDEAGENRIAPAGACAALFVLLNLCVKLPDPGWVLSLFSFVALLPMVEQIRRVNERWSQGVVTRQGFSVLNVVGIVIGGLVFILAMIGTLMPSA